VERAQTRRARALPPPRTGCPERNGIGTRIKIRITIKNRKRNKTSAVASATGSSGHCQHRGSRDACGALDVSAAGSMEAIAWDVGNHGRFVNPPVVARGELSRMASRARARPPQGNGAILGEHQSVRS
jgi:hypothetical protein